MLTWSHLWANKILKNKSFCLNYRHANHDHNGNGSSVHKINLNAAQPSVGNINVDFKGYPLQNEWITRLLILSHAFEMVLAYISETSEPCQSPWKVQMLSLFEQESSQKVISFCFNHWKPINFRNHLNCIWLQRMLRRSSCKHEQLSTSPNPFPWAPERRRHNCPEVTEWAHLSVTES